MEDTALRENMLLGLGNPLLDISATTDEEFLEKYGLKPNDAILAEKEHMPLYNEMIEKYKVEYIAGGACQNTMRVAQWILGKPKIAAFMGCIGHDEFGKILKSKAEEAGVNTFYQYNENSPTGTCAVVITNQGANRSLCANLSAANCFTVSHIEDTKNWSIVENAKLYYITGFFLTVSPESIMKVAKHAAANNKRFCMNLSAPFICEFFAKPLMEALPYVDIIFGNEQEAVKFSQVQNFGTEDISQIALRIANMAKKNDQFPRIVIITQGEDPVVVVAQKNKVENFSVTKLKSEEIVDTNGAGDSFVGGFLSQYIQGKPLKQCVKCGIYAATEVIKQSGCTFPTTCNFTCDED